MMGGGDGLAEGKKGSKFSFVHESDNPFFVLISV
jgi:hypothetical protein